MSFKPRDILTRRRQQAETSFLLLIDDPASCASRSHFIIVGPEVLLGDVFNAPEGQDVL
jgi:hypothetical protein